MCLPRTHSQSHSSTVLPLHSEPTDSALLGRPFQSECTQEKDSLSSFFPSVSHLLCLYSSTVLHTCQYHAMILFYCFCCVSWLEVAFLLSPCYSHSYNPYHNKKEQKFISLLTSTTCYCIIGTEVHELLFLVYRNSCSLSSRLYKKIAASHRQLSLPAKNSKISHMEA